MKFYLYLFLIICTSPFVLSGQNSKNNNLKVYIIKSWQHPMLRADTVEYLKLYGLKDKMVSNKINYFLKQSACMSYYAFRHPSEYNEYDEGVNFPNNSFIFNREIIIDSCDANECNRNDKFKTKKTQSESRFSIIKNVTVNIINNLLILDILFENQLDFYGNSIKNCKPQNTFKYNLIFDISNGNNVLFYNLFRNSKYIIDSTIENIAVKNYCIDSEESFDCENVDIISHSQLLYILDSIIYYNDSFPNWNFTEGDLLIQKFLKHTTNILSHYYIFDGVSSNPFYIFENDTIRILCNVKGNLYNQSPLNNNSIMIKCWVSLPVEKLKPYIKDEYLEIFIRKNKNSK